MTNTTSNNLASYCWSLADLLRGDFKQSQYGRIILPFTLLRRLECVLEASKAKVLAEYKRIQPLNLPEEAQEKFLLRATEHNKETLSFYNVSLMDLSKLGQLDIKPNLESYIQGFSKNAREIFEYFNFAEFISQLNDADLLFKVVQKVRRSDLSPKAISNHDMGLVFEELIRRFAESSNETAGEHFTPRDIVRLTTALVFLEDDEILTKQGIIRTIYDPTAGTGGFLSSGMEYVHEMNPQAVMSAFGQELNPESYAICKADMLIKGQDVTNIKLGNTLSHDHLQSNKFDYMLSNPPFGVDWKKIETTIKDEHSVKGLEGRFGAGLPRVSDGSLLFLMHLISKLNPVSASPAPTAANGGRIGIILNGSPLFTGGAGSGESEIRRYLLEEDLVEAIIGLPTDMFYNTGIATYIWILSNKKTTERKGKVQLINGVNLYSKMRKSLGSKRNEMSPEDITLITRTFGAFEEIASLDLNKPAEIKSNRGRQAAAPKTETAKTFASKIFANHEFGYRRITIERPLRESYQFSNERIAELRFDDKQLKAPMQWVYENYGHNWTDNPDCENYGVIDPDQAIEIRVHLKANFSDIKETKIKDLLASQTWLELRNLMLIAKQLQQEIGSAQHDDMNTYNTKVRAAMQKLDITLTAKELRQITAALSWKNSTAAKVIKKIHKDKNAANPIYGLFNINGKIVEYQADTELRDYENIPLDPSQNVDTLNEAYFIKEVQPHVPDAWIDASKTDAKDEQVGIIGYEIPFNRHFYEYQPPRDLAEIDADLNAVSAEIMALLQEVHS